MNTSINIKEYLKTKKFFVIAGPCALENEELSFIIADKIFEITKKLDIPFVFKASYRKANRTSLDSFSGIGDVIALNIIKKIGNKYNIPTITDIHNPMEAKMAAEYVDILQIPAFLCRQTDLLTAAAKTQKMVNIKKGQFLSADVMKYAIQKITKENNNKILLTERGNMFGYNDIVVDYRNIVDLKAMNYPVVLDITHSLQMPNQTSGVTGGKPEYIEAIASAGIAVGADGIFVETHPNPKEAKSDGANMLNLDLLEPLLEKLLRIKESL